MINTACFIYEPKKKGQIQEISKENLYKYSFLKDDRIFKMSYSQLVKKQEFKFKELSKGIFYRKIDPNNKSIIIFVNKTLKDFEKLCKKNNWPFREPEIKETSVKKANSKSSTVKKESLKSMENKTKSIKKITVGIYHETEGECYYSLEPNIEKSMSNQGIEYITSCNIDDNLLYVAFCDEDVVVQNTGCKTLNDFKIHLRRAFEKSTGYDSKTKKSNWVDPQDDYIPEYTGEPISADEFIKQAFDGMKNSYVDCDSNYIASLIDTKTFKPVLGSVEMIEFKDIDKDVKTLTKLFETLKNIPKKPGMTYTAIYNDNSCCANRGMGNDTKTKLTLTVSPAIKTMNLDSQALLKAWLYKYEQNLFDESEGLEDIAREVLENNNNDLKSTIKNLTSKKWLEDELYGIDIGGGDPFIEKVKNPQGKIIFDMGDFDEIEEEDY